MSKNVFISGAAGFIGFHLAKHLHAQGCNVVGFDNFNGYYNPQLKRDRSLELAKIGVKVLEGDLCDHIALQQAIEQHKTTHCVHLAAQAGVRYSLEQPRSYLKANIDGFLNVLEICREYPSIKLIYASSSSVYGNNAKVPFSIEDRTDCQASLYGVTKKTNELMANTYSQLFGITAIGLRFFSVYGPWGRPDMAYYSFSEAIMAGRSIDIYNHGHMQRDFTYIDDIVDGVTAVLDLEVKQALFNLGNHQPVALLELVELLENHLGKKTVKNFLPMQAGDVVATYADISESSTHLNFVPKVSIQEGIKRFATWYLEYKRREKVNGRT